jgi:uncharacterized protein
MSRGSGSSGGYFAPLANAKYVQLTTFRRNGTPVPTPVHIVVNGDVAYFRTWDTTGKAKRLRHTSSVRVAPSTARGRPVGQPIAAQAALLTGDDSAAAAQLLSRKHPVLHGWLIPRYHRLRGWTTQQYRLTAPAEAAR